MCRSAIGSRFACGRVLLVPALAALLLAAPAAGEPYWIAYEGDDLPENQGWTRYWGNHDGEYQGPGGYRTIEDGIITYDSLYDPWVYDYNFIERPGGIDPEPGEIFRMEWRLRVDQVDGYADPAVYVASDEAWQVTFGYRSDRIISVGENLIEIPITEGVWHEYRLESNDMRTYALHIDGHLARLGYFVQHFTASEVGWGDGGYPASSLHSWDYFNFGVVPEPRAAALLLPVFAGTARRRNR